MSIQNGYVKYQTFAEYKMEGVGEKKLNYHVLKIHGFERKNEIFYGTNYLSNIQLPNGELGLSL